MELTAFGKICIMCYTYMYKGECYCLFADDKRYGIAGDSPKTSDKTLRVICNLIESERTNALSLYTDKMREQYCFDMRLRLRACAIYRCMR